MNETPTLLGGRYEVGDLIGRGGMAEVHVGHDTRLGRAVAIKMLRSDLARDHSFLTRFRREAQAAAGLAHPNIVAVFDSGEDRMVESGGAELDVPYIVMEFVDGLTLREVLNERTLLPPADAARVTEGILDALGYSHEHGIVHRDIKPANVMITKNGQVKVMDFGIARAIADSSATMTQTQAVIGTAQYLSPEQAQGQSVDARSDLYSTGCLLFELLTGRPPFQGESPVSIAYQHVGELPPRPSQLTDGIPPAFDAVVAHALEKDREARYPDAEAFHDDLQAARLGRPLSEGALASAASPQSAALTQMVAPVAPAVVADPLTRNTSSVPAAAPPQRKNRSGAILVGIVIALLLAALGWAGYVAMNKKAVIEQVAMPAVTQMDEATATKTLTGAGFGVSVVRTHDKAPKTTVFRQDPEPGRKIDKNSKVTIWVSQGPSSVKVPDLKGKTQADAEKVLTAAGLKLGAVNTADDPSVQAGRVISSDPGSGQDAAPDSAVNLTVASGKVTVPNVVGHKLGEALDMLRNAGFKVATVLREDTNTNADTVLEQSPGADSSASAGTTVKLVISKSPAPTVTTTLTPTATTTTSSRPTTTTTTTPPFRFP